jgi:hypothetical protein
MNARLRALAALLGLAAALAACGPGVGGTGTGEGIAHFGASAESLCTADFADRLACAPATSGPVTGGTAAVDLADAVPQARVAARFEGDALHLDAPCQSLAFSGQWGRSAALGTRFFGTALVGGAAQPATLTVLAGDSGFVLALFDADDRPLFGPSTLQRVDAAATPGGC